MRLSIYTFIFSTISLASLAQREAAQYSPRVTGRDSILLFHAETDANAKTEILKTKGHVPYLATDAQGGLRIGVFKQYVGYFEPGVETKGLPKGLNALPGHDEITYHPTTGFKTTSSVMFNLNSGLNLSLPYRLLDVTSLTGGVSTAGNRILSDASTAVDYNAYLRPHATTLGFRGHRFQQSDLSLDNRRQWAFLNLTDGYYAPYAGEQVYAQPRSKELIKLADSGLPLNRIGDPIINAAAGTYTVLRWSGTPAFVTVDATGKVIRTVELPEIANKFILATTSALSYAKGWTSSDSAGVAIANDYVFGLPVGEKGYKDANFLLVRIANDGQLIFKHAFHLEHEYAPAGRLTISSNEQESIVRIMLGKGLFKYTIANVKINATGIVYTRYWTRDEDTKKPVVFGFSGMLGNDDCEQDWYLFSLPNQENIIVGETTLSGEWKSYTAMHLLADGSVKKVYRTRHFAGAAVTKHLPKCVPLPNGRVAIVINEPTPTPTAGLRPFQVIDYELAGEFPSTTKGLWKAGESNVLFNTVTDGERQEKKLVKIANALVAGETPKDRRTPEGNLPNLAPAVYVIDVQKEQLQPYNLMYLGAYSIPQRPSLFVNVASGEFLYVGRTLPEGRPQSLTVAPGQTRTGRGIYLKAVRGVL